MTNNARPLKQIHCLQHVPFEGPNYIAEWADKNNCTITVTELFSNFRLPELEQIDLLVILGGPMSIHDEKELPWLTIEKKFIKTAIDKKIPLLGICLGAQHLAQQLGANVYKNSAPEIGWFPINVSKNDLFKENFTPLHWHGETFDLPDGVTPIGSSKTTKNQGFIKDKIIALQFHLEATGKYLEDMLTHAGDELIDAPTIQRPTELKNSVLENSQKNQALMDKILKYLLS